MRQAKSARGFTLIETIIYLALFSIIIGGVLVSAYQIIQASTQSQENALVQEEVQFLMGKIRWAMTGAETINDPIPGNFGSNLNIDQYSGINIIFTSSGDVLSIQKTGDPTPSSLNSDSVKVENVKFTHIAPIGTKPAALETVFKVTSKLTGFSQTASSTIYLRK